jgi:hypothetical protein
VRHRGYSFLQPYVSLRRTQCHSDLKGADDELSRIIWVRNRYLLPVQKAQKTARHSLIIDFPYSRGRRYPRRSVVAKRSKYSHMICSNLCIKSDFVQLNLVKIYSQMIQDSSAFLPRYWVKRFDIF